MTNGIRDVTRDLLTGGFDEVGAFQHAPLCLVQGSKDEKTIYELGGEADSY